MCVYVRQRVLLKGYPAKDTPPPHTRVFLAPNWPNRPPPPNLSLTHARLRVAQEWITALINTVNYYLGKTEP